MVSSSKQKCWTICTLLSVLIFIAGTLVPLLGLPLMFLYSAPILVVTMEAGLGYGIASALISTITIFFTFGPAFSLIFLLSFALQGILLALTTRKLSSGTDLVLAGLLIALCCKVVTVLLLARFTGVNFLFPGAEEIEKAVLTFWQSRLSSLAPTEALKLKEQLKAAAFQFAQLVPFVLIAFSSVEVLTNYFASSYVHKKMAGSHYFALPAFGTWSFPRNILLALMVGFFCEYLGEKQANAALLKQIGINLSTVTRALFVIQGLAVVYNLMQRRGFPRTSRIIMLIVTPLVTFLSDIFSIVGIIDIGFDLRKRLGRNSK